MGISVKSRVHRTLCGLERFRRCERWDQLPQLEGIDSPLKGTEMLLGVYENLPGRPDQLLLFTDLAVHLWEGSGCRSLKYADIAATEWPTEAKNEAGRLVIRMKNGVRERLPVLGGTQLTRDLFEVMRFIDRIIEGFK